MAVLKRFELWLLLILISGGLLYVFNIENADDEHGRAPITTTDADDSVVPEPLPRYSLQKTTLTRDGDHFLAEITIHCRNDHEQALKFISPGTRLMAAGGQEIPAFFLPFQPASQVPKSSEADVTLRYWLSNDDIIGPVSLQINEDIIPIKRGGFKIEALPDKQSLSFTDTDWSSKA